MSNTIELKPFIDESKIGELAAQQPLSGMGTVVQTGAVNGRGGFVHLNAEVKSEATTAA